jgi:hypothetical protein
MAFLGKIDQRMIGNLGVVLVLSIYLCVIFCGVGLIRRSPMVEYRPW